MKVKTLQFAKSSLQLQYSTATHSSVTLLSTVS